MSDDIFEKLLEAKWRDVSFPVSRMKVSLAHDLVEHKAWGVDGARVESTGLAPLRFHFTVPLINGLTPGKGETWRVPSKSAGDGLYPGQMRKLVLAFQDKSKGMLQHPEFGLILCKPDKMDLDWDATRRGGTDVEMSFVETTVADVELRDESPVGSMEVAIGTLDSPTVKQGLAAIFAARGIPLPDYLRGDSPFSFTDALQKIKAIVDYPSLVDKRLSGKIDAIVYHAENLEHSLVRAKTPKAWPAQKAIDIAKATAFQMEGKIAQEHRRVAYFYVPDNTTLAGVVQQIPDATVEDLVKLNPKVVVSPIIFRGTLMRYYKPDTVAA